MNERRIAAALTLVRACKRARRPALAWKLAAWSPDVFEHCLANKLILIKGTGLVLTKKGGRIANKEERRETR